MPETDTSNNENETLKDENLKNEETKEKQSTQIPQSAVPIGDGTENGGNGESKEEKKEAIEALKAKENGDVVMEDTMEDDDDENGGTKKEESQEGGENGTHHGADSEADAMDVESSEDAPADQGDNDDDTDGDGDTGEKDDADADVKTDEHSNVTSPAPAPDSSSSAPASAPAPATSTAGTTTATPSPPPPLLRGTLSYNEELRRHLIRGMWNYEGSSNVFPPQRFELLRNLDPGENAKELPKDGEFHGSFSLAYFHTTSKGKQKERSKVIPESGVNIKFTKMEDEDEETWKVDGKGTNQFGIFHINGIATPTPHGDGQYQIVLRKRYEPNSTSSAPVDDKVKKRKIDEASGEAADDGPLPPPSQSYEKNVVCLRGKLYKEESEEFGLGGTGDVVHRITGMWSSGLDLILADPQNVRGLCNRFEYEHKSSQPSTSFPISGRYSGWFDLNVEDGSKKKIVEKDVNLRFRKNNAGYHNVEGRGSNAFGKYSITGTLTSENVITIFRHFQVKKLKAPRPVTSAPPPINAPGQARRPSLPLMPDPQLKLEDVKAPEETDELEAFKAPERLTYSAVSRGVLRLNPDGSLSCSGKWAVTRDLFTNGQTSNFAFRLEAHFAVEATKKQNPERQFPLDSEMYKGSFQLKKGGTRYQTVIDQQVVMKFRKNSTGSYNVYGRGVNAIGTFILSGTLIMSGKTGGQVELYRMYPPDLLNQAPAKAPVPAAPKAPSMPGSSIPPANLSSQGAGAPAIPPARGLLRRESSRMVKVPSRLEDDDPQAQLERMMDKCNHILRFMREKDVERGAFFSEPVDPVALGIPTYSQVISEPMDLRTLHRKMEAGEVTSPEEFARLTRLVFENAMTFNVDPTHSVHQAARNLLIVFNQKFRDVDRMIASLRRNTGSEKTKKGDKKRKRDEPKSLKQRRFDEAQEMAAANSDALQAIVSAAPATPSSTVSRDEFNLMFSLIRQLQQQIVQTYSVLAEMTPDVESTQSAAASELVAGTISSSSYIPEPIVEKRKPAKRKSEPRAVEAYMEEDSTPLTLAEQKLLTELIDDIPPDKMHGLIQIIREATNVGEDEEEIDLEIDQLDNVAQRKLLNFVTKHVKPPKRQKNKGGKRKASKKTEPPAKKAKAPAPAPVPKKQEADSFFSFGGQDDSDSDSDDDGPTSAPIAPAAASKTFTLGDGFDDDDDSDKEEDSGAQAPAAWNISKPANDSKSSGRDDDDAWGAARESAAAAKAREEDKKKREEKLKAEAEQAKKDRLAQAVAHGEEIKAQRQAEEEEEARQREEQEKEAEEQRRKAREEARAQVESVEQTVDLDEQRDMMRQLEQNFLDKDAGSASPSSDFGF